MSRPPDPGASLIGRLSGLEVRHLLALRAVVDEGSFRAAAQRLGYAQPSVSAQIGALERMVGMPLLVRDRGRPVGLTDPGRAFYDHALSALARIEAGGMAASLASTAGHGRPLRLGTFPSVPSEYLSSILDALGREEPPVELVLRESTAVEELEALVVRGDLDLTFSVQPFAEPDVVGVALAEDPFVLLVPSASPLADPSVAIGLGELADLPLIASPGDAHILHLEHRMRLRGMEPTFTLRTDDDRLTHALVAEGAGFAVIGGMQVDARRTDTFAVDLGDLLPPRVISLAWHPDRPLRATAERLVERVVDLAAATPRGGPRPAVGAPDALAGAHPESSQRPSGDGEGSGEAAG